MNITFIGAAQAVTGSCTLIECAGKKLLIDCGLPQGFDARNGELELPFSPSGIDFILLTHAHIDHSGRIPLMVRQGFTGSIHATEATTDLCAIMLADSGHIQEMEARWLNQKRKRAGKPPVDPLYTVEDARIAAAMFEGHPYQQRRVLAEGIEYEFVDAGHLLGSSSIQLWLTEDGVSRHIVFSGDIGNVDQPLVNDPMCLAEADYVVVESTYGDRNHPKPVHATQKISTEERSRELAEIIRETFRRGGNVIIPSFAVGRTQELLYLLRVIVTHHMLPDIPEIPVFLDSPLAIEATRVYSENIEGYFDEEAMDLVRKGINPLTFPSLTVTVTADESRALNNRKESAVIISASGMCEAGRIKHHLKHNLWRHKSTIVFCGYQAGGTLGRAILNGAETVSIFGDQIEVKAEVRKLDGISAHADREGLFRWLECFGSRPKNIFVVHGEKQTALKFAADISDRLSIPARAPASLEAFDLLDEAWAVAKATGEPELGQEELETAFYELNSAAEDLQRIIARLTGRRQLLAGKPDAGKAARLAGAAARLAEELELIDREWKP